MEHGAICFELVGLNVVVQDGKCNTRRARSCRTSGGEIRVFGFVKAGEKVFGGSGRVLGRARGLPGGHCEIQIAIDFCVSILLSGGKSGIGCERS